MMTKDEVKKTIDELFGALGRACGARALTQDLFDKAYAVALKEERRHRRGGFGVGGRGLYRQSAETAARYFVVRDWHDPTKVASALDAVTITKCALYGAALRQLIDPDALIRADFALMLAFEGIEYRAHLAQALKEGE